MMKLLSILARKMYHGAFTGGEVKPPNATNTILTFIRVGLSTIKAMGLGATVCLSIMAEQDWHRAATNDAISRVQLLAEAIATEANDRRVSLFC